MKEKIKQLIKFIKQYLPNIIILTGIFILFYKILMPTSISIIPSIHIGLKAYNQEFKLLAIMLIVIGIDIAIRRYIKNEKKNM